MKKFNFIDSDIICFLFIFILFYTILMQYSLVYKDNKKPAIDNIDYKKIDYIYV